MAFDCIDIDDDIILIESDLIYEPTVIERVITSKNDNVALVSKYKSGMDGTVVKLSGDVVTDVIPSHLQDERFDFTDKYKTLNIYKFSRDFCRFFIFYNFIFNHFIDGIEELRCVLNDIFR